jgi:hypothetical protein
MAGFQLTKGLDTFNLDTLGAVTDSAGKPLGKWSTSGDADNRIVITPSGGGAPTAIDVGWKFDGNNQLCILNTSGKLIFNFHSVAANRPFYSTLNAVLQVRPDQNNVFGFDLHGDWDIDAKHNLLFKTKTVTSSVDGFIQDTRSRFMYTFFNKQDLTQKSILGFVGHWDFPNANQKVGLAKLDFVYDKTGGQHGTFILPKGVTIDRVVNQLMYEYDKQGHKFRVQFVGLLEVSEDFQISYTIDRQVSGTGEQQVAQTKITVQAAITKKDFSGNVEFVLLKQDGSTGSTTIAIGGSFTAMLGKTKLQVGFAFQQTHGVNVIPSSFAFNGTLTFGGGGQIQWAFEKNATSMTLSIAVTDIQLGKARADFRLNLKRQDGSLVGVQALFGISF